MPISKGPLSTSWWRILKVSLRFRPAHPTYTRNYLALRQGNPSVAAAVADALMSGLFRFIMLYTLATKGGPLMLIGQNGRTQTLLYPECVPPALENELLLNAQLTAQRSLLGYIWNQEGGTFLLLGFPAAGVLCGWFGYLFMDLANHPLVGTDPVKPVLVIAYTAMVAAACIALWPLVWGAVQRSLLRRALHAIGRGDLDALNRAFDQTVKPSSA